MNSSFCVWVSLLLMVGVGESALDYDKIFESLPLDDFTPLECNISRDSSESTEGTVDGCRWSNWTGCAWNPKESITDVIMNVISNLKTTGCRQLPKFLDGLVREIIDDNTGTLNDPANPLRVRLATLPAECGNCGIKMRCCVGAEDFFTQSVDGGKCSPPGAPAKACVMDPLSGEDLAKHHSENPAYNLSNFTCDFNQLLPPFLTEKKSNDKVLGRLWCSLFDVNQIRINCKNIDGKCHCCCAAWQPNEEGNCVPIQDLLDQPVCRRNSDKDAQCEDESPNDYSIS